MSFGCALPNSAVTESAEVALVVLVGLSPSQAKLLFEQVQNSANAASGQCPRWNEKAGSHGMR
jgi:hypothetical protein